MKPGDLVTNNTKGSYSKLFSSPLSNIYWDHPEPRKHLGNLLGIGMVLDVHGSDVKLMCGDVVGWSYVGNFKVISEDR